MKKITKDYFINMKVFRSEKIRSAAFFAVVAAMLVLSSMQLSAVAQQNGLDGAGLSTLERVQNAHNLMGAGAAAGIPWVISSVDENNERLDVAISVDAPEPLEIYEQSLKAALGDIPMHLTRNKVSFTSCPNGPTGQCDPIIGAIAHSTVGVGNSGFDATITMGVVDASGVEGFLIAGHAANFQTTDDIGQPNDGRIVGDVLRNPVLDSTHPRTSDSAFVDARTGFTVDTDRIFDSTDTTEIVAFKTPRDEQTVGTAVTLRGVVGDETNATICDNDFSVQLENFGILNHQVGVNPPQQFGDSGGPVTIDASSPIAVVNLFGSLSGRADFSHENCSGPFGFYSPWDEIRSELNLAGLRNVATYGTQISPTKVQSYENEKRVVEVKDRLYSFYYDGSNIVYRTSTDDGRTWGSATSLVTGQLVSDTYRWSILQTTYSGTTYIYVFYWVQGSPDTQNHHFKLKRGTVSADGSSVTWSSAIEVGYTASHTDCGTGGACAAVVTSSDSTGTLWAAWRYKPGGQSDYYFAIKYSNDGGFNWYDSWSHSDIGSTYPPTMALTPLASGKMLWAYAFYNSNVLNYKVFTPGVGWNSNSTAIIGWTTTGDKQISAASDSSGNAYIALVTGGTSGSIKVAKFTSSGSFSAIETPPSGSLSHSLPSIVIASDDAKGVIRIYTIASSKIYDTKKVGSTWQNPVQVFDPSSQTSPDQLTAGDRMASGLWKDGTNIKYPYNYY